MANNTLHIHVWFPVTFGKYNPVIIIVLRFDILNCLGISVLPGPRILGLIPAQGSDVLLPANIQTYKKTAKTAVFHLNLVIK